MNRWWWMVIGVVAGGPIWIGAVLWLTRGLWRSVRKIRRRGKGREQLVELGQLAGGLAHEIKNPLSTINVNLKLLAEDIGRIPDDTHRRWLRRLESVQGEADRMRGILDDFLRYAGKYELTLETVELARLVGELADFFAPQAESARVVMRMTLPTEPVRVRVDAGLLKQAMLNLLINAVQAMGSGGELIVRLTSSRDRAALEIIDTGSGIAPEELDKVFEVYYSTKKRGTGLGLPTTRRIVREHGGTLLVESDVGKGTRFVISLPLAKE